LVTRERFLGGDHPETARSLHELAELYLTQGKLTEAESLNLRALGIREKAFATKNHPDVARSLFSLAQVNFAKGRYAEAKEMYQESADIIERVLGNNHSRLSTFLQGLARLHHKLGQYDQGNALAALL
jgi:tetratricopeptide (TPR) repeat protein